MLFYLIFLCGIQPLIETHETAEQQIVIVTASYKNAHLLNGYFTSILNQTHRNKKVIYVADNDYAIDSDGTGTLAHHYVTTNDLEKSMRVVRNKNRQLALKNLYRAILSTEDEDVIAIVDGDDELATPQALSIVDRLYANQDREIWATYGNFKCLSTNQPWQWTQEIPLDIIASNSIRKWQNGPTHLKTFKSWLFREIHIKDLFYEGDFFKTTYDVAIFEPLYEMIGERFASTQEVLYAYNDLNPLNDHKINRELQLRLDHYIRAKPPYARLAFSQSGRITQLKESGKLTADIVLFCSNPQQLPEYIQAITSQIKNGNTITAIIPDFLNSAPNSCRDGLCDSAIKMCTVTQLPTIIEQLPSDYVLFLSDEQPIPTLDITDALVWLEKTHAHAFYCCLDRLRFDRESETKDLVAVQISLDSDTPNTIYAWQYQQTSSPGLTTHAALLPKTDLMFLGSSASSEKHLNSAYDSHLNRECVGLFYHGTT